MISIDILLATFNGEPFLQDQIDSLLRQTQRSWRLIIRDDTSTDGIPSTLAEYASQYPAQIIIRKNDNNLGILATFNLLLQEADADWIMFCDQDDVWLPEKIERSLALAQATADRYGLSTPLLVHTDLKVVDERLTTIADSLWRYQKSDPEAGRQLNRLLLQNPATGCTMMINRALRDLALPIPAEAVMHDWWLALTATAFGRIEHLDEPTILYRQHDRNDTGAKAWGLPHLARQMGRLETVREEMCRTRRQAAIFLERFGSQLDTESAVMLRDFATLGEQGFWEKRRNILRHGLWYAGTLRNLGWFALA